MASNSRPSCSICSSLRWASGLSIMSLAAIFSSSRFSQGDLDRPLGGVDTGADDLSLGAGDLPGAQVADLPGAERSDAGVADPLAAAEGQRGAGLLARDE